MQQSDTTQGIAPPDNPWLPGSPLRPFEATLDVPQPVPLQDAVTVTARATTIDVHPDLPAVPVWGYGIHGHVTSPGPLLEAARDHATTVTWRNRLETSLYPRDPQQQQPELPFATAVVDDPAGDTDSVQNYLGSQGGTPQALTGAPLGWLSTHLHGGHSSSDADGWPDNMTPSGGQQVSSYDNTYDNLDIALTKIGALLWYHDHAMNGTPLPRLLRARRRPACCADEQERRLGLPTTPTEGEIVAILQDRNIDVVDRRLRFLHKITPDTGEFFGPLTLVNGKLWPHVALRPATYRLRLLSGSNARTYRLHLVTVESQEAGHPPEIAVHHDCLRVIGSDGGLLWKPVGVAADAALTLAPAERLDLLVDLSGFPTTERRCTSSIPPTPHSGGSPTPTAAQLTTLWLNGDSPGRNPYPWVLRIDVDPDSPLHGIDQSASVFDGLELNPAFRRTVHDLTMPPAPDAPPEISIEGHDHHAVSPSWPRRILPATSTSKNSSKTPTAPSPCVFPGTPRPSTTVWTAG